MLLVAVFTILEVGVRQGTKKPPNAAQRKAAASMLADSRCLKSDGCNRNNHDGSGRDWL